jgi:hypothetical protein
MKAKTTDMSGGGTVFQTSTQPHQAQPNGDDPQPTPTDSCPKDLQNPDGSCPTKPDVITGGKAADHGNR